MLLSPCSPGPLRFVRGVQCTGSLGKESPWFVVPAGYGGTRWLYLLTLSYQWRNHLENT